MDGCAGQRTIIRVLTVAASPECGPRRTGVRDFLQSEDEAFGFERTDPFNTPPDNISNVILVLDMRIS